jgi:hypothetical protein
VYLLCKAIGTLYQTWHQYPHLRRVPIVYGQGGIYLDDLIVRNPIDHVSIHTLELNYPPPLADSGICALLVVQTLLNNDFVRPLLWSQVRTMRNRLYNYIRSASTIEDYPKIPFDMVITPTLNHQIHHLGEFRTASSRTPSRNSRSQITPLKMSPLTDLSWTPRRDDPP